MGFILGVCVLFHLFLQFGQQNLKKREENVLKSLPVFRPPQRKIWQSDRGVNQQVGTSDISVQNWAMRCGRNPEQFVSRFPCVPIMALFALNTPVLERETGMQDSSAWAPSCLRWSLSSCPWSFSFLSSPVCA